MIAMTKELITSTSSTFGTSQSKKKKKTESHLNAKSFLNIDEFYANCLCMFKV
jgi:hypothetical protein